MPIKQRPVHYSSDAGRRRRSLENRVIILGAILLILGLLFSIPILWTIGIVVLVVGLILLLAGSAGRAVGGRRHWY